MRSLARELMKERSDYTITLEDPVSLSQSNAFEAIDDDFGEQDPTLAEFVNNFIDEHAVKGPEGGVIVLDVSKEEFETIGRSFTQVFVGWAAGLRGSRRRRGILPVKVRDNDLEEFGEDKEGPIH